MMMMIARAGRGAKAFGGVISAMVDQTVESLIRTGSLVSLGFVALWVCDAPFVSRIFEKLVATQERASKNGSGSIELVSSLNKDGDAEMFDLANDRSSASAKSFDTDEDDDHDARTRT